MIDDGFLDQFDDVIFCGCYAGGYAAAAYSVSYPMATVITINPQATLNPSIASWDKRFKHTRRQDFTKRFGYAPKMCESAKNVFVFYDADSPENAMHAALLGQAQARPGPLLTKLVCQHTLRLHPTAPKFVAALQQVEQTAAE